MGTHATPELTAPVSRGQQAATGILQNIGTALGSAAAGSLSGGIGNFGNNSMGGTAYNGIQSANQIPSSRGPASQAATQSTMAVVGNPAEGGASFAVSTSSVNPLSIQNDSSAYVNGEKVVTTDAATSNVPATGHTTVSPKSNAVELPASNVTHVVPSATIAAATAISYKGEFASRVTGSVNDNTINKNLVPAATAEAPKGGRENGAATFGVQAAPTTGNPSLPADGGPTSSVQVRSTLTEGQPNNLIPFENGTADKP